MKRFLVMRIEKLVPMQSSRGVGRPAKYPFGKMDVGDSFFLEADKKQIACARAAMGAFGFRHGKKFSSRAHPGGVRIWRTK